MYNENNNMDNSMNNNMNGSGTQAEQPQGAAEGMQSGGMQDNIYRYTREDMERQWQPNTGSCFTDTQENSKAARKARLKREKAARKQAQRYAKAQKKKQGISAGKLVAACAATGLVAVLASSGVMYGLYRQEIRDNYVLKSEYKASSIQNTNTALNSLSVTDSENRGEGEYSVSQVAKAVLPSVVSITSTAIVQSNYNPFFGGGSYQVTGAGSGIIVGKSDTELLIVTNNHVVADTTSLTLEFADGSTVDTAYVKGTNSTRDVAIVGVKIDELSDDTIKAIKIAVLGDSDSLQVGDNVVAIGNALGYGQSVTSGVVSALNRDITLESGTMTVIQTDASINGGNSGGALVNRRGEVIGINVAKASQTSSSSASVEGMGYAIPISQVKDIINELMNKETRFPVAEDERGYVGITSSSYVEVDSETSKMYNIPEGIYMREINEGTPIDKAGISIGDVITAVEGNTVKNFDELQAEISCYKSGETITLTVQVAGEKRYREKEIDVTLVSLEELNNLVNN